jgi:NAD(P) transhydrogenase subunit alpha
MALRIGVLKETPRGEKRVSLVPADLKAIKALGADVAIETGAGVASAYPDAAYEAAGASVVPTRADLLASCDLVLFVSPQTGLRRPGPARSGLHRHG